jgi:hypothetical protein
MRIIPLSFLSNGKSRVAQQPDQKGPSVVSRFGNHLRGGLLAYAGDDVFRLTGSDSGNSYSAPSTDRTMIMRDGPFARAMAALVEALEHVDASPLLVQRTSTKLSMSTFMSVHSVRPSSGIRQMCVIIPYGKSPN